MLQELRDDSANGYRGVMEEWMVIRLVMLIAAVLTTAAGFSASAYSLTQGQTDQAIAFAWPSLAISIAIALVIPKRRQRAEAGVK